MVGLEDRRFECRSEFLPGLLVLPRGSISEFNTSVCSASEPTLYPNQKTAGTQYRCLSEHGCGNQ